ncbi:RnfABCDGE type electron transport complex subunit D [Christensenellaceae bacterium OttesenSCG-928-K19]|nr:RnfABCDGE type electron transport complex subunit D [Christensenellaceae bacterium OttesenSCG-928-K19]
MQQMILSGSPHIRSNASVTKIMLDVIIALVPACIAGVYFFGPGTLTTIALCIASAVGCEAAIQYFTKRDIAIKDLSAVLTGLLLALNLPPNVPWYLPVFGAAFAIIIVKQCFGGLGHNFMNPALGGRAFLMISWPVAMTAFLVPNGGIDAISTATPLAALTNSSVEVATIGDLFFGNVAGCIGETSAFALLIGGAYLLIKRIISFRIPGAYLGTVAVFACLTALAAPGATGSSVLETVLFHLLSGGVMLGAFFMATDYVTSPMNRNAQIVFGVGCGVVTMVIRLWGGYPEGVSFSILFMNLFAPLLDRAFKRKVFGEVRSVEEQ